MYALNVPITVTVDDLLPVRNRSSNGNQFETLYAAIGEDNSIWGAIIEKAFAKLNGNYARIVGGDPVDGINTIQGAPNERHTHALSSITQEGIWSLITEHDARKGMLTAVTSCDSGSDDTVNNIGLVNCHAYPVLGYAVLDRNG